MNFDDFLDDVEIASDAVTEAVKSFFEPKVKLPNPEVPAPSVNRAEVRELSEVDDDAPPADPKAAAKKILQRYKLAP